MDWSWLSPLSLACFLLFGVALYCQTRTDRKKIRTLREFKARTAVRRGKKHSYSAIIHLRRRAHTILPLLEHLASHNYNGLSVLVVVHHTAGKNAARDLRRLRATYPHTLRIIHHKRGMATASIVQRYSRADLIMSLAPYHRLSPDFFVTASVYMRNRAIDALRTRQHYRLDARLTSAVVAIASIWRDTLYPTTYTTAAAFEQTTIYRRRAVVQSTPTLTVRYTALPFVTMPTFVTASLITRLATQQQALQKQLAPMSGIVLILAGLCAGIDGYDLPFFFIIAAIVVGLMFITQLRSLKAYSVLDQITLLLFAPFALPLLVGITLYAQTSSIVHHVVSWQMRHPMWRSS